MKVFKKEKVVKEVVVENYTVCDKCKERIETEMYDAFESSFSYKIGNIFPEGGYGKDYEVHLCQSCSSELFKWLRDNDYNINESEWEV